MNFAWFLPNLEFKTKTNFLNECITKTYAKYVIKRMFEFKEIVILRQLQFRFKTKHQVSASK